MGPGFNARCLLAAPDLGWVLGRNERLAASYGSDARATRGLYWQPVITLPQGLLTVTVNTACEDKYPPPVRHSRHGRCDHVDPERTQKNAEHHAERPLRELLQ